MKSDEFNIAKDGDLSPCFERIQQYVKAGGAFVTIRQRLSKRTNNQNALLWAIYGEVLKMGGEAMAGWTKEDIHDLMLGSHFGWEVLDVFGKKRHVPRQRSSKLSKLEFAEFVEFVYRFMAEQGIYLPSRKAI